MSAIQLVVTDLDGTLWDAQPTLHPKTREALDTLQAQGMPLLAATGRREHSTRAALAGVGLQPPAVMLNGALGLHLDTGERFHRHAFEIEHARTVLQAFTDQGLQPCVYVEHQEISVVVDEKPSTHPDHLRSLGDQVRTGDLREAVASLPILHFGLLGVDRAPLQAVHRELQGQASLHLDRDRQYGGSTLTVGPPGLSKWCGVEAYCKRDGLSASQVLAVGDGPNDAELLREAAIAVVPADAHPEALALADHIVPPARDGGWAQLLDLL